MKVPYQFNNKSYTSNYIFILIKTIYKQYSLLLYIDFMPIYPVIDYKCYCCYCLGDPFHAVLPTGKSTAGWKEIVLHETMSKLCKTDPEASAVHTSRWLLAGDKPFLTKHNVVRWRVCGQCATSWCLGPSFCVNRGQGLRSWDRKRARYR